MVRRCRHLEPAAEAAQEHYAHGTPVRPRLMVRLVDVLLWIAVAVGVGLLLLRIVGRRALVGRVDPTDLLLEPELVDQVRALARAGRKAEAITLLRRRTPGLGLAPATVMVERMAAPKGPRPADGQIVDGPVDEH